MTLCTVLKLESVKINQHTKYRSKMVTMESYCLDRQIDRQTDTTDQEQFPRSILARMSRLPARMSRGCYEETAVVEFQLNVPFSRESSATTTWSGMRPAVDSLLGSRRMSCVTSNRGAGRSTSTPTSVAGGVPLPLRLTSSLIEHHFRRSVAVDWNELSGSP